MGSGGGLGSMISGVGNIYSGFQGQADAQAAAQTEWNTNDALAQYNARLARQSGAVKEENVRVGGASTEAQQGMAYANSGVDAGVGTAAQVQANTAAQTEMDAQTQANNTARQAWGFKVQQEQAHQTYVAQTKAASNKAIGSILTGAGQIMGGFSSSSE